MAYIGSGISKFNTADGLTVSGDADIDGSITSSAGATITTADNTAQLTLKSTDADANVGPLIDMIRDSASPADGDELGRIRFKGDDDGGNETTYAYLQVKINDATDASDDGELEIFTRQNANGRSRIKFGFNSTQAETVFNEGSQDIDFRVESDGNANMLFVDGGNNAVGIGAAPNTTFGSLLYAQGAPAANKPIISGYSTGNSNNAGLALFNDAGNRGIWTTGSTMRFTRTYEGNSTADLTIDASGNVGIGTAAPTSYNGGADDLVIATTGSTGITIASGTANNGSLFFADGTSGADQYRGYVQYEQNNNTMTFGTNGAERMRVDSSGVVTVGKTDAGSDVAGATIRGNGQASFTKASDGPLVLNRKTNQGYIALFQYDNTSIGQIGVDGNDNFYITGQAGNTGGFYFNDAALSPAYQGAERDNYYDLGKSAARFDDIFATNATIQTSDQNEKQQITNLTTAEITAAKAISALFKTFKWKDKVEAKGDDARTHTGVIAQEVQTAMSNAGLDAADYAFWCSDTWWETSTNVPAVEASEEVLDKFGTVTTEAVEAKDAYTRIDTYYKADEAPDGATQITRMGIRYPELLAFVGAATEQRLANIETRLTALEAE